MAKKEKIKHGSSSCLTAFADLFWDVPPSSIDFDIHARFVIERVLERGSVDDWLMLLDLYGKKRICEEVVHIRSLDPKSLNFLSVSFSIDKDKFRCCS